MPKLPDSVSISGERLATLFPFHLLLSADESPTITSAGSAIAKSLPEALDGIAFFDEFEVRRPRMKNPSAAAIRQSLGKLVVLKQKCRHVTLRGQFVGASEHGLLFLGSLFQCGKRR